MLPGPGRRASGRRRTLPLRPWRVLLASRCRRDLGGALDWSRAEADALFAARRLAFPLSSGLGPVLTEDVCVPKGQVPAMLAGSSAIAESAPRHIANIAHAGDGNLHPLLIVEPVTPPRSSAPRRPSTRSSPTPSSRRHSHRRHGIGLLNVRDSTRILHRRCSTCIGLSSVPSTPRDPQSRKDLRSVHTSAPMTAQGGDALAAEFVDARLAFGGRTAEIALRETVTVASLREVAHTSLPLDGELVERQPDVSFKLQLVPREDGFDSRIRSVHQGRIDDARRDRPHS